MTDGQTDGRTDRWTTDGRTDGRTETKNQGKVITIISDQKSSESELILATFGYFPYRRRRFPGGGHLVPGHPNVVNVL